MNCLQIFHLSKTEHFVFIMTISWQKTIEGKNGPMGRFWVIRSFMDASKVLIRRYRKTQAYQLVVKRNAHFIVIRLQTKT